MNIKKVSLGLLGVGSALALARLFSANSQPAGPATQADAYEGIDTYINDQVKRLGIPGVTLVIVEGDRIVHWRGFGRARPDGEIPGLHMPFFIGSVTKSFTALAVMQLVEAGKVELDAPVQRYLPWFRVNDLLASARMTVRHLLNQTSGFPMFLGMEHLSDADSLPGATERQARSFANASLSHPIGTKFEYSNANYNLLGLIVEAASGEPYPDYVQKHIFDALSMRHSYSSKRAAQPYGLAMGYRYWFGEPVPAHQLLIPMSSLPSGQLISCAEDLAHYLIAQLNGGSFAGARILSAAGMQEMHRGAVEIHEMGMSLGSYAMGWMDQVCGSTRIVHHSGIVPDYGAFAALIPEQMKGFALLFNANHAMLKLTFDEFGLGVAQRLAGEVPAKAHFGGARWLMRGLVLIPLLQALAIALTLKRFRRWQSEPATQPSTRRFWTQHILLPLIPDALLALSLLPLLGKMRGWMELFMPDFSQIARLNGGLAVVWAVLRTRMALNLLRKSKST